MCCQHQRLWRRRQTAGKAVSHGCAGRAWRVVFFSLTSLLLVLFATSLIAASAAKHFVLPLKKMTFLEDVCALRSLALSVQYCGPLTAIQYLPYSTPLWTGADRLGAARAAQEQGTYGCQWAAAMALRC